MVNKTHKKIIGEDVALFSSDFHEDFRGDIWTSWDSDLLYGGMEGEWRRDKFSTSSRNVLRGLHGDQKSYKLISCVYGEVYFVVVNPEKTNWDWVILSSKNKKQVLVPPTYCNGIYVLSHKCVLHYKYSYSGEYHDIDKQFVVKWNDPNLNIEWPSNNPIVYDRDR